MDDNSNLKLRKNESEPIPEANSYRKGILKRRIVVLALAITLLLLFVGCNATDAQKQEARSKTQTAMARPVQIHRRAGCTNKFAVNYDQWATANDGSCEWPSDRPASIAPGCTDSQATNYDPSANWMDGSCQYPPAPANEVPGCTDPEAVNRNTAATWNDGSCVYKLIPKSGCTDMYATNYTLGATVDDYSCVYPPIGCTDPNAANYNSGAKQDDGSCTYANAPVTGCTDKNATNYNSAATQDDGSCKYQQADLPAGFPSNVPNGTYTMSCNGQSTSGSIPNNDIVQFAKEVQRSVKSTLDQASAACSSGSGCSCTNDVGFTPWNGSSFSMNISINVNCCVSGQCVNVPVAVSCIISAR